MDNISNLSSNLPLTKPVSEHSLQEITASLTNEFRNAAKSVSSLYKLSVQRNDMIRHQGYLDAVNDLIQVLTNGGDVENWAVLKKLELEGTVKQEEQEVEHEHEEEFKKAQNAEELLKVEAKLPSDYSFNFTGHQTHKFPPSQPLISIERKKKVNNQREKENMKEASEEPHEEPYSLVNSNKRRYDILKSDKRPKF